MNYAVDSFVRHTPGDVDENGVIDTADIIATRRFITGGWGVVNETAAGVDADGKHSAKDVILLRRYIACGYGVELK